MKDNYIVVGQQECVGKNIYVHQIRRQKSKNYSTNFRLTLPRINIQETKQSWKKYLRSPNSSTKIQKLSDEILTHLTKNKNTRNKTRIKIIRTIMRR